jgi:hypothetical protein
MPQENTGFHMVYTCGRWEVDVSVQLHLLLSKQLSTLAGLCCGLAGKRINNAHFLSGASVYIMTQEP